MMFSQVLVIVLTRVDDQSVYVGIARNFPDVFEPYYEIVK